MPSNQFVQVAYTEDRTVFAGGNPLGQTNCLLTINTGTHTFDLGEPADYDPPEIVRKVANTSVGNPLQLSFQKTSASGSVNVSATPPPIKPE